MCNFRQIKIYSCIYNVNKITSKQLYFKFMKICMCEYVCVRKRDRDGGPTETVWRQSVLTYVLG